MKTILFCCAIIVSTFVLAKEKAYYQIINQEYNKALPKDSILISGKITYDKSPEKGSFGKVTSLDFRAVSSIQVDRTYTLKIHKKSKGFYFFQNGYREVVVKLNFENTPYNQYEIDLVGETHFAQIMVEKPVIYCYSPSPIELDISLSPTGKLAFTYPLYDGAWHIRTQADGQIQDLSTGKHYPYLFWEAQQNQLRFQMKDNAFKGFIVKTDTIVTFLEQQLQFIGLNANEATDFITYWAPRIQQKEYAMLQFKQGQSYTDTFGGIHFSQTPDVLVRIGLLFSLFDEMPQQVKAIAQSFSPVDRKGFTVIEWGGAELTTMAQIIAKL